MNQFLLGRMRWVIVCACSLFVMLLFTACSGTIGTGTSSGTITGSVVSVNQANHSATVNVNGQQFTINGLSDPQVSQIQVIGWDLFTRYVYPFELTSVLLLVGVIGVMIFTKRRPLPGGTDAPQS